MSSNNSILQITNKSTVESIINKIISCFKQSINNSHQEFYIISLKINHSFWILQNKMSYLTILKVLKKKIKIYSEIKNKAPLIYR